MSTRPSFFHRLSSKVSSTFSRKSTKKNNNFSNNSIESIDTIEQYRDAETQLEKLLKLPRHTKKSNSNNTDKQIRSKIHKIMQKMERFDAIKKVRQNSETERFLKSKQRQWIMNSQRKANNDFRRSLPGVPKTNLRDLALRRRVDALTGKQSRNSKA